MIRGEKRALNGVTLRIRLGENTAILGPNGSGKSTLIKLITRECYPVAGTVKIFGEEAWDVADLRSRLGIVTNDLQAMCDRDITGIDAVVSGFFSAIGLWRNTVPTAAMRRRAVSALKFMEAGHLSERRMNEMSTGEARRVLIARAMAHDPSALILDEPTASLDVSARLEFQALLKKIVRSGKTIVLVTHDLHDITPEIGRIVVLKSGKVHGDGPPDRVLTRSVLSEAFGAAVSVKRENGGYGWG